MLTFILSLLLMTNVVGYENIDNVIVTPTPVAGISDIKIDRQTSVHKAYLDGVKATQTSQIIPVPSGPGELNQVSGYTYAIVGYYYFDSTADAITIPEDGTYLITASISINDLYGDSGLIIQELQNNGSFLYQNGATSLTYYSSLEMTYVGNFSKSDVIKRFITMDEETNPRTMNCYISITKLS